MRPRSSSLIAPALSAAQTSNTYTCPVHLHVLCTFTCPVHLQMSCAAVTPQATVVADLLVPTLSGFAVDLCALSTQAKASHSGDTARKGSAALLLLHSDAEDMMPCTHSGGPELYVRVVCSASQTPKTLPSKEPYTHIPSRSDGGVCQ